MAAIRLIECKTRSELKRFVRFAINLYRGNNCYVPPIVDGEIDLFDPQKNPSLAFCDKVCYLAVRDEVPVGRIAGIINPHANEKAGQKRCRFGYCDFINEKEVSRTLLNAVAQWGREHGMTELVGPLGFTDLDMEGCLIDGFDRLCTAIGIYNHPYYAQHFDAYGMKPEAFWNEYRMRMPAAVPERYLRMAENIRQRLNLTVIKPTSSKKLVEEWGRPVFDLINKCYAPLYGTSELTSEQKDFYISVFLPQVRIDHLRLIVNSQNELVAFGIANPSLSRALQKAKGRLWPVGWIPLLKTLMLRRQTDTCDLYLVGVRPDMQGRGINALLFAELIPEFVQNGYKWVETTNELETNLKVQNMWRDFDPERIKRRCTFVKSLNEC